MGATSWVIKAKKKTNARVPSRRRVKINGSKSRSKTSNRRGLLKRGLEPQEIVTKWSQ
jgi:hypothetical protein